MEHLEKIWVQPSKFKLGFNKNVLEYISWKTYLDTWKLVDSGIENPKKLPLYHGLLKYYSEKPPERLVFEQNLLGLNSCRSEKITAEWIRRHIQLFHSIKDEGYIPERRKIPITTRILEDGSLWLMDGTHTVSILRYLERDEPIETVVKSRDGGWIQLKEDLYRIYDKKLLYQPTNHPDFADWEVDRQEPHRWAVIKNTLGDIRGVKIVDVGSCTGWFSIELAKMGATVTGLEPYGVRTKAAKLFAKYEGLREENPRFLEESFEMNFAENHYDVCLILSVLHHYLRKSPQLFYDAVKRISTSCDCMIIEMGVNRLPIKWNPELIIEHSKYRKYTTLWSGERPVYLYE